MSTWAEFESQAPDLAVRVRARFEAHKHLLIATLRRDGAPRISGTEAPIGAGELWLGCMPGAMKGRDLLRDSRFALHSAPLDLKLADGDAKVSGRALEVTDEPTLKRFWASAGHDPMAALVFRCELEEAALTTVDGDDLVIDAWRAGEAPRQVRRR